MSILSIHHITIVSSSAQRTADFYAGVLGLRLVKKTVNFDAPSAPWEPGVAAGVPGSL